MLDNRKPFLYNNHNRVYPYHSHKYPVGAIIPISMYFCVSLAVTTIMSI